MRRLCELARTPSAWGAFCAWKPFSLTSYRMMRHLQELEVTYQTILDGGANVGQFSRAAHQFFPRAAICAFEPLPESAQRFTRNLPDVPLFATALGKFDGTTTFFPGTDTQASNCSEPQGRDSIEVPMRRLDTLLRKEEIRRPALLKLDLQGHELPALEGSLGLLPAIDHVLVEVSHLDEFEKILTLLKSVGLSLHSLPDASYEQVDVLFTRT